MSVPPSTTRLCPVTNAPALDARKSGAPATSSGVPGRGRGVMAIRRSMNWGVGEQRSRQILRNEAGRECIHPHILRSPIRQPDFAPIAPHQLLPMHRRLSYCCPVVPPGPTSVLRPRHHEPKFVVTPGSPTRPGFQVNRHDAIIVVHQRY